MPAEPDEPGAAVAGEGIVRLSWAGTVLFAVTAAPAAAFPAAATVALVVAVVLFLAGAAAFTLAFVAAVARSRTDLIGVMALFFLEGTVAPRPVRRLLLGSFIAELAVAGTTAALRPNTSLAFGVLAPVFGLAMAGLWGARHGTFAPRPLPPPGMPRRGGR